jgi:hypothetical protein
MSRFWIIWGQSTTPITRYPSVRFVAEDGRMSTIRIYDAFDRNQFYMSGGEYVYPVELPLGTYTVLVATDPTHARRVRVYRFSNVCAGVIRFDPAPGRPGQLAVGMVPVATDKCGPLEHIPQGGAVIEPAGVVESVPFTDIIPEQEERGPGMTVECPDLERAQQWRSVRQMVLNGQAPIESAAASQFYAPKGLNPMVDQLSTPLGFESGLAWGSTWH